MTRRDKRAILQAHPLFGRLAPQDHRADHPCARSKTIGAGTTIFRKGDPGDWHAPTRAMRKGLLHQRSVRRQWRPQVPIRSIII